VAPAFTDRVDAGRQLAERLTSWRGRNLVVLGLPRGGVPVAAEVAAALEAPLEVIVVRKLGVPFQPELAMGAIGEGGLRVLHGEVLSHLDVTEAQVAAVEGRERAELETRVTRLRSGRQRVDLQGRVAIVVDDGIATGSTARVACQVARHLGAARVVLAIPVAPADTVGHLTEADEVVCVHAPRRFVAVGYHYRDFSMTSDEDVIALLGAATARRQQCCGSDANALVCTDVHIDAGGVRLEGQLRLSQPAVGIVLFAHGTGSSRHSPRNQQVAAVLHQAGISTLLFDLLTVEEEQQRSKAFDIELLAGRLASAVEWLRGRSDTASLPVGFFGASTGAAAALWAAAGAPDRVAAVVSRGGRPDLAEPRLPDVRAPTLLIVGGADEVVLRLNRLAQSRLDVPNRLAVVKEATHLFEEPGAMAEVAELARDWFTEHFLP
jgi:putative phosphoribosyl transferase